MFIFVRIFKRKVGRQSSLLPDVKRSRMWHKQTHLFNRIPLHYKLTYSIATKKEKLLFTIKCTTLQEFQSPIPYSLHLPPPTSHFNPIPTIPSQKAPSRMDQNDQCSVEVDKMAKNGEKISQISSSANLFHPTVQVHTYV